jgi:mono/diheme cytochrome c family protein
MAFLAILSVGNFESLALASFNGKAMYVANSGSVTLAQADHEHAPAATEFHNSCAVCHGLDGHGNGPMAVLLKVKPPDLTSLAAKNGGTFPFDYVMRVIDGRAAIRPHGTHDMPVWGDRYMQDFPKTHMQESYRSKIAEPLVRARILELTYYLQSIQR